jgi:hypothetical protein
MHKTTIMLLAFTCCSFAASAQVSDKIDKAAKDPATQQRSAKADALLIDKKQILPQDSTQITQPGATGKKRRCIKNRS